jgi:hypothetical protein
MFGLIGGRSGIPSIRIDSGNRRKQNSATRFRNDPDILVLLLHGCVDDHVKQPCDVFADDILGSDKMQG